MSDYKFYRDTKSMREKIKQYYSTHASEDQKEKDYKGMLNSRMKVSKHQQYWLRQFDWVYSQINKGDQSASSREDEDLLILVESHLDKHKDFAAKYAANTADFQKFRAEGDVNEAKKQVPQSKNLRGGKSRGEATLEERQAELKAAQEKLAEVLADDKGTDKRIEEIDELQKQVKDLEAVEQMQALAGLGNNNNIQPPGAAPPVVPQQQPPPAPPPSVIPQQAAQGQPGEAIDPPEMQDAEATPEMKEAEETAFGEGKVVSQAGGLIPNTTDDAPNIGIHQKAITRIFIDRNKNFTQVRDMLKGKATAQSTDELMREFRFGIRVEGLLENTQQEWDEIQALVYQYRLNVKEDEQVRQATIAGRQATATAAQGTGRPAMVVPLDMIGQEARDLILADLEGDAAMGEDEGGAAGHDGEEGEEGEGRVRGRRLPEDNNINLDIRENDPENEVQGRQDPDAGKERGGPFKVGFKVENPTRIRNLLMPNSLLKYNPLNPRDPLPSFRKVANPEFVPMSRPSLFFRMDS